MQIKEQAGKISSTAGRYPYEYRLSAKIKSAKHNKYAVNQKLMHIDDAVFIELSVYCFVFLNI